MKIVQEWQAESAVQARLSESGELMLSVVAHAPAADGSTVSERMEVEDADVLARVKRAMKEVLSAYQERIGARLIRGVQLVNSFTTPASNEEGA